MIPKSPDVYFDIARENRANSDVIASGGGSITSYTSNNRSGFLNNWTLKDPELYYNPWNLTASDRCEATELKTGVWHITKLTPPTTNGFNSILFSCPVSTFKGIGNKFGIFISKPEGREFDSTALFYNSNDDTGKLFFQQYVVEGMNIIDLSEVYESPNLFWRLKVPESFYNRNESGGLLETETDFYVVFFPVFDQLNASGFGIYNDKTFNDWQFLPATSTTVSEDGLTAYVDNTIKAVSAWAFRDKRTAYYKDEHIIVFSPWFNAFKRLDSTSYALLSYSAGWNDGSEEYVIQNYFGTFTLDSKKGNVNYYGGAVVGDFPGNSYSFMGFWFNYNGTYQMLPYNFDKLAVRWEENKYGNYIYVQENGENIGEIWNTIIADFTNKKSQGDSYISRVVWTQSESDNYDGYKGLRITANDENTLPAYQNAFNGTNDGITYINGRRNQTLLDKDLLYTRNTGAVVNNKQLVFGDGNLSGVRLFADRVQINTGVNSVSSFDGDFYKFLAFKEPLTTWQINYLMKIYNFYK